MVHNLLLISTGRGSSTPLGISIHSTVPTFPPTPRGEMPINKATGRRAELFSRQRTAAPCAVAHTLETERWDRRALGGFPL